MVKRIALLATVLLFLSAAAATGGEEMCPCVPISHVWVSTACETFDCVMSSLVVDGGTPYIVAVPTGGSKYKWVVVRRVVAGSAVSSPDEPSIVDSYNTMAIAAEQFDTLDPAVLPKMISTVDGKSLIVRLREADPERRRAIRR
jgi:hypothetical protein